MLFSKPGLTLTKALTGAAICLSSTVAVAAPARTAVRPAASVPAVAVSSAAVAAATANPCVAGAQGCVLPTGQTPVPVETGTSLPPAAAYVEPAAGFNLLPWIVGAGLIGGLVLLDPFDLFGEDCEESPNGDEICGDDLDEDDGEDDE